MQYMLLVAVGLTVSGIGLMLFGIGYISSNPKAELPIWTKITLIIVCALFIIVYGLLVFKLLNALIVGDSINLIDKGGIRV